MAQSWPWDSQILAKKKKNLLGLQLDSKLPFTEHTNNKISKATKAVGLLRKLQPILPRRSLLIIYKSFIRPHLDYGDVIYAHSFQIKLNQCGISNNRSH